MIEQRDETGQQKRRTPKWLRPTAQDVVHKMVEDDIDDQFRELGYNIFSFCKNVEFGIGEPDVCGSFDFRLDADNILILVDANLALKTSNVLYHIEQMEKFRSHLNRNGNVDPRQLIGAVAGFTVEADVVDFAHANGLYVIVQSGETMEIIMPPEGFQARKW